MSKLKGCFSMFVESDQREKVEAELVKEYEESGKSVVQSQNENVYGVIDRGVLYVRRIFPMEESK
jgi:hypothetical protein